MVMTQLQVGLAKNVEECMEFAPEGGKVVVRATPKCCSSRKQSVQLSVALQSLEVRFTEKIQSVLLHYGLRAPINLAITLNL
jgi:centromere/kinetochore protein ZW10